MFTRREPKPDPMGVVMQPSGPPLPASEFFSNRLTCIKNLKAIGSGFAAWSSRHHYEYPFNVSTNAGGTKELCAAGPEQFDSNAVFHFQVMTNPEELTTPALLVCPQDKLKKPAPSFSELTASNVTYRLRTGVNITGSHPKEVLIVCPVDGNILYCDGTVVEGKK